MTGSSPFVRFLLAITALLCSALVYASPRVHAHDRRDDTTWTAAPTKSSCANCYGIDATWTVTRVTSAVNTTPLTLTTVTSATVLAVVTEVPIPGGSVVTSTMWPLPQVSVKVGERVRITLVNDITPAEDVTLHFHGVVMGDGYVSMDGPESVTQCGLSPKQGENVLVYDFPAKYAGTFWIHSHDPGQYPKGLRTSLIVTDEDGDRKALGLDGPGIVYDDSHDPVTLSDWYADFWGVEASYLQSTKTGNGKQFCGRGVEISPDAIILNDYIAGVSPASAAVTSTGYTFTASNIRNTIVNRLRFINTSAFSQYFVRIDGHSIRVVELDGILVSATATDGFVIAPGQRVSVLVDSLANVNAGTYYQIIAARDPNLGPGTKNRTECSMPGARGDGEWNTTLYTWGCIYYGSMPSTMCPGPSPSLPMFQYKPMGPNNIAKLNVPWSSSTHTELAYPWSFNERTMRPLVAAHSYEELLNVKRKNVHWLEIRDMQPQPDPLDRGFATMNQELWEAPDLPAFLRATQDGLSLSDLRSPGTYGRYSNTIIVDSDDAQGKEVVWLVFQDSNGDHPMHLHGHHFQLLYKGSETDYSIGLYRQAVHEYNTGTGTPPDIWRRFSAGIGYQLQQTQSSPANPMTRDTLMAEKYQFTVVAFVADNPGVWALHCHNDFHARSGMFKQVVEMPSRLVENLGTWARDASAPDGFRYTPPVNRTWSEDGAVLASWKRNLEQCAASGSGF